MGAMKQIATKLQAGLRLDKDERRFVKVFCSKPKLEESQQLDLFFSGEWNPVISQRFRNGEPTRGNEQR